MSAPSGGLRRGIRVGIDVGTVRVGVARTDPEALLAVPVTTVARRARTQGSDLAQLARIVAEHDPLEVVVGLPITLAGQEGPAVAAVRAYVEQLQAVLDEHGLHVPVRLVDERLSTAAATRGLQAAGRDARSSRSVVDQAAAVVFLQDTVDFERRTGRAPGTVVPPLAPHPPATDPSHPSRRARPRRPALRSPR